MEFFAAGVPAPKGSTRSFARGKKIVTTNDNERTGPWQGVVAWAAQQAGVKPAEGGVELGLCFYMPRPKGHRGKNGRVRDSAPTQMTTKPDVDKLVRCVLDALTGIAYHDDSQVIEVGAVKRWEDDSHPPGVRVLVRREAP